MHYSLLTLATVLAHSQAQYIPMPFGLAPVPIPQGSNQGSDSTNGQGNIGHSNGAHKSIDWASSMGQQGMASSTPSPSMAPHVHRPFHSAHYHYHMTPVPSSASHYINKHMSMHISASASASASMSLYVSAAPSASASASASHVPYFGLNHGLNAPHPHEGFPAPKPSVPKVPDFVSNNGQSTKHGGYSGGNGNGFTQTHGQDESSDGSPPINFDSPMEMPSSSEEPQSFTRKTKEFTPEQPQAMPEEQQAPQKFYPEDSDVPSFKPHVPQAENLNQDTASFPGSEPSQQGSKSVAPVDSLAPGTNVAPTQPQKSHGADIGNSFCMGGCHASPDEAKCEKPYSSPVFQEASGCYSCCFTSPDF